MVYIIWKGFILEMAANDSVKVQETSDISKHKLESGSYIGDHVVLQNKVYTISGMVSNITSHVLSRQGAPTSKNNQRKVTDYFELLSKIRDSREVVTLAFDSQIDLGGIQSCIIKDINYSKSPNTGLAYMVNMTLEQLRITESPTVTTMRERQTAPDKNQEIIKGGRKTTTRETPPPSQSLALSFIN